MIRQSGSGLSGAVLIGVLLIPLTAHGYILQGPHVLQLMTDKLSGPRTLRVQQTVTVIKNTVEEAPVDVTETLSFIFPNRFRSDAWYQGTNRILVTSFGRALTVIDGKVTSREEARLDRYKDLLLHNTRAEMLKGLLMDGVDLGVTSLGRMEDRVVYVIGAQYPDESVSQIWVDKERFLPLRWISMREGQTKAESRQRLDFIYRHWQKRDDYWYPMLIESYLNQQLVRSANVRQVQPEADFSAELLNIAYLLSVYPRAESPLPKTTSESDVDEVQQTIDEFRKKFEP